MSKPQYTLNIKNDVDAQKLLSALASGMELLAIRIQEQNDKGDTDLAAVYLKQWDTAQQIFHTVYSITGQTPYAWDTTDL